MKRLTLILAMLSAPALAKTDLFTALDGDVAAASVDLVLGPVVPSGKTVKVSVFGGSDVGQSGNYYALQWGSGGSWQTIRAAGGTAQFGVGRSFVGDGAKRFRLVRGNMQATTKKIVVWVEGFIDD